MDTITVTVDAQGFPIFVRRKGYLDLDVPVKTSSVSVGVDSVTFFCGDIVLKKMTFDSMRYVFPGVFEGDIPTKSPASSG